MPVKARCRINEAGIYSHIYNKGIEKRIIFNDEEDYQVFIGYLEDYLTSPKDPESVKKTFKIKGRTYRGTPHQPKNYLNDVELIAYSLIPDHFHLVLHQKTPGALGKFIRSLCTRYSMYFNKKYQHSGTLFEGPYKSILIGGNQNFLPYLSLYLHHAGGCSSYLEYLGKRSTTWVKPQVILSLFKMNMNGYKYFMEDHKYDRKEKEFIGGITFNSDAGCLERSDLASSGDMHPNSSKKPRSRLPEVLVVSTVMFFVLFTLGIRNVNVSANTNFQPEPTPEVLAETEEAKPKEEEKPEEMKPKIILTVKMYDASSSANIRKEPTTDSEKIGKALDGETLEYVSRDSGWYEVRLADGTTGFILGEFIVKEETSQ